MRSASRPGRAAAVLLLCLFGGAHPVAPRTASQDDEEAAAARAERLALEREASEATDRLTVATVRDRLSALADRYDPGRFPALPERLAARARSAELSAQLAENDEAAAAFAAVLAEAALFGAGGAAVADAALGLAEIELLAGRFEDAARLLQQAAEEGGPAAAVATRRLALVERLLLRPRSGQALWLRATLLSAGMRRPAGVAADDDGRLLVCDPGARALLAFGPDGTLAGRRTGEHLERPFWGPRGSGWAAAGDALLGLTAAADRGFDDPRSGRPLGGLAAGAAGGWGEIALLSRRGDRILLCSHRGCSGALPLPLPSQPVDVARGPGTRLFVLDGKRRSVEEFDGQDPVGTVLAGAWQRPEALAIDAAGDLYVLDAGARQVLVYGPAGAPLARVGPDLPSGLALANPRDVAVDGAGRLFVADPGLGAVVVLE